MIDSVVDLFQVGDTVYVDAVRGFSGSARVVEVQQHPPRTGCKVLMDDGSQPPFWAHDFELTPCSANGDHYDSRPDTLLHILEVRRRLNLVIKDLERRWREHDLSKLSDPEKAVFDEFTPKLKNSTYGSEQYQEYLVQMRTALDHHYAHNSHHPEFYSNGIDGMSLLDLIELVCDWKAATLRHADGDLRKSIEYNQKRFGYTDQLKAILINTATALGFFDVPSQQKG
jgi:hypothetical protein